MEAVEANNIPTETLSGISSSSQPTGPPHIPPKPTAEEIFGSDLRSENGGGSEVVVTTVVEKTEVTVVTVVEEHHNEAKEKEKDAVFDNLFDGDDGIDVNFTDEKLVPDGDLIDVNYNNDDDNKKEKEGVGHLFDFDEGVNMNFTEDKSDTGEDPMDVSPLNQKQEKPENVADLFEFTGDINENKNEGSMDDEKAGVFELTEDDNENKNNEGTKVNSTEENRTAIFEFTEEDMVDEKANLENGAQNQENEEEVEEHDYVVGDFVWGKIKSHPWWPGQIYDPSTASEYATSIKRKGHLLVAYFGDGSFSWCSPSQLKPFIDHFQEMSNQSDSRKFTHAVKTALDTVSNLIESELTCKCGADRVVNADMANGGIKPGVPVPKGNTIKVLMDKMSPIELVLKLNMYAIFDPGYELELGLELTVVKSWLGAFYFQKGGYVLPEYHEPKCIEGLEDQTPGTGIVDSNGNGPSECNKSNQKRKQKSVAELLSVEDEPKIKKPKPVKDSGGSGRKRKAAVVPPPALVVPAVESPESDISGGGGGEDDTMYSPRQRKKSKYLSPPYLSPTAVKLSAGSGSGSFKEPKPEPEKDPKGSEMGEASPRKKQPRLKKHNDKASDKVSKEEGKMVIDAGVDVDKMLSGLLLTALDPTGSVEKKRILGVTRFVSSFRSSVFENGAKPEGEMEVEVEESDVGFVKRKVEEMREMVNGCDEEAEMGEEVKAKLEGVIMEVLERVK